MLSEHLVTMLPSLVSKHRDPFCAYIYDLGSLHGHVKQLVSKLPINCELFYAVKANPELPILRALAPLVHGFEVASSGEIQHVRANFPETPIIFGGPGKLDEELNLALSAGIETIHVESIHELERIAWIARQSGRIVDILLRINLSSLPDGMTSSIAMGGKATQFGIDSLIAAYAVEQALRLPSVRLRGFHFHLLSQQKSASMHLKLMDRLLSLFREWTLEFGLQGPCVLNAGGGFGIEYSPPHHHFDWNEFCVGLNELIHQHDALHHKIRFEAGRYITAACGYYVTEVLDIKENFGTTFVVCRGGTQHFRTPLAQGHSHPFSVIDIHDWKKPYQRLKASNCDITITGQLCTPKDVLAKGAHIQSIKTGDLVAFPYAGAYAWHISPHDFLKHPPPEQIYI